MSTDVYFDCYAPSVWPSLCTASIVRRMLHYTPAADWKAACSQLAAAEARHEAVLQAEEAAGKEPYAPLRVSYLSNLLANGTYDLWQALQERWEGVELTQENIDAIVAAWAPIYAYTQRPENAEECGFPEDIDSPEEIHDCLVEYRGYFLTFRVD